MKSLIHQTKGIMKLPRKWHVKSTVTHDLQSAVFAWDYARARAKQFGLRWKVSVYLGHTSIEARWYGHAYGSRGNGSIHCWVNGNLPIIEHADRRFKNQPAFVLWGAEETIAFLIAHELGHVIGYGGGRAGEMACNKFGFEVVQAWRARQYADPACLI